MFIAARGGVGGRGNQFYVSNEVRKPFKAEYGGEGEEVLFISLLISVCSRFGVKIRNERKILDRNDVRHDQNRPGLLCAYFMPTACLPVGTK